MKIPYYFTLYDYSDGEEHITNSDIKNIEVDLNDKFPSVLRKIIKINNYSDKPYAIYDLKKMTWGIIVPLDLYDYCEGDDYTFDWLNYTVEELDKSFELFKEPLNISIDGPGIGDVVGDSEGISFYINSNEKDRHEFEPHVHCYYGDEEMRVRIDTLEIMKGDKPFKNGKKVKKAIKYIESLQEPMLRYYKDFSIKGLSGIKFKSYI